MVVELDDRNIIDPEYELDVQFPTDVLISFIRDWDTVGEDTTQGLLPIVDTLPSGNSIPHHAIYLDITSENRPMVAVFVNLSYYREIDVPTGVCMVATFAMASIVHYKGQPETRLNYDAC